MYSFGPNKPRAIDCFGVSGLLTEGCQVYYQNLSSPRHIGRVSDLILAKLGDQSEQELRLRGLLLYTLFAGLQAYGEAQEARESVVLECGVDSEKVGFALSFVPAGSGPIDFAGIVERVRSTSAVPSDELEWILARMLEHAHRVVIRVQPSSGKVELISLLGLKGKMDQAVLGGPHEIELVMLNSGDLPAAPAPQQYVALGDLDYAQLLKDSFSKGPPPAATGEILVKSALEQAFADRARKVAGAREEEEERFRVKGSRDQAGDDVIRVSGGRADASSGSDRVLVAGHGGKAGSAEEGTLKYFPRPLGEPGAEAEASDSIRVDVSGLGSSSSFGEADRQAYEARIVELQRRIDHFEQEKLKEPLPQPILPAAEIAGISEQPQPIPGLGEEPEEERPALGGFFKKVWPFGKKRQPTPEKGPEPTAAAEDRVDAGAETKPVETSTPSSPSNVVEGFLENEAGALLAQIEKGGLTATIGKFKKEMPQLQSELSSGRSKFVEGMMSDLLAEKARLNELAKQVTQSLRQKEAEMRNKENQYRVKERALQQELRDKDRALRHKDYALSRVKDMLAQTTLSLERLKASKQVAPLSSLSKTRGSSLEVSSLQTKLDQTKRQLEEFKKANQQLMDRLNENSKKGKDGDLTNVDELKRRLDGAMKLNAINKKQSDRLAAQVEALKQDEMRLKSEISRLQAENASLKPKKGPANPRAAFSAAVGTKPGGGNKPGGSTPPAAA